MITYRFIYRFIELTIFSKSPPNLIIFDFLFLSIPSKISSRFLDGNEMTHLFSSVNSIFSIFSRFTMKACCLSINIPQTVSKSQILHYYSKIVRGSIHIYNYVVYKNKGNKGNRGNAAMRDCDHSRVDLDQV